MDLLHEFYVQPMHEVFLETVAVYILWTFAMVVLKARTKRILSAVGLALSVTLILLLTVMGRGDVREICMIPFETFKNARLQPEFYRTMFMNMVLFLPFGLTLPFAIKGRTRTRILLTVAAGLLISAGVEALQYIFCLGKCETDDIIMNTLGVMIGASSYLAACAVLRREEWADL